MSPCSVIWNTRVSSECIRHAVVGIYFKRIMIKQFRTYDSDVINSCMLFFGLPTVSELIDECKVRFC